MQERLNLEADARRLGITLNEAIENAHPEADGDQLTNLKVRIIHQGFMDGQTQSYLQQQLQKK